MQIAIFDDDFKTSAILTDLDRDKSVDDGRVPARGDDADAQLSIQLCFLCFMLLLPYPL